MVSLSDPPSVLLSNDCCTCGRPSLSFP